MKKFGVEKYDNGVTYYYLFGRKVAKKIRNCFSLLGKKPDDYYEGRAWYTGWHDWNFEISYEECGYEEGNGELHISLLGWHSVFTMPWKSKRFPYGDCDAPKWGIAIHDNTFWIYKGGNGNLNGGSKWWTWDLPFFTRVHMRHQVECDFGEDGEEYIVMVDYEKLMRSEGKDYVELKNNEFVNKYHYNYTDSYDGTVVPCTYWVEEREWRRKWLTWCKVGRIVNRYIEIEFDGEVGKGKETWKGGCVGCSYDLLDGETPEECIKRMERERIFN